MIDGGLVNDIILIGNGSGWLEGGQGGDGLADFTIQVASAAALVAADFML